MSRTKQEATTLKREYLLQLGLKWNSTVICPVCLKALKVKGAILHHLIPKILGAHLVEDLMNLVLVHSWCHRAIHEIIGGPGR